MFHFERELPTYAEPVSATDLKIGETYFSVQYLDEDLLFPTVETLVLAGKDQDAERGVVFCFQDLGSWQQGIRHGSADATEAVFYFQGERNLRHIFEYERAVDELIKCALRRQKK
ncbi:MAG: hypothetical protein WB781_19610 [Candidatus Sulfotelmatobacter sp.]